MSVPAWDIGTLVALMAALGSLIVAVESRHKQKADAADMISKAATSLVEPLEGRVKELEKEVKILRAENRTLRDQVEKLEDDNQRMKDGIAILIDQIKKLGHNPAWGGVS
jgi:predicted RNase H-like nuclease (RuvC/YqgF family)